MELSQEEVMGKQDFSWNVLFPNESNLWEMCKNCFKYLKPLQEAQQAQRKVKCGCFQSSI